MIGEKTETQLELEDKIANFLDSNGISLQEGIVCMLNICISGLHASGTELLFLLNVITEFYKELDEQRNKND
jgi:hypothetical protein